MEKRGKTEGANEVNKDTEEERTKGECRSASGALEYNKTSTSIEWSVLQISENDRMTLSRYMCPNHR